MDVSIIIPSARKDAFTAECLLSVCKSLEHFKGEGEIILAVNRPVDFGSDIILSKLSQYACIHYMHIEGKKGSAYVRSKALAMAKGEVVLFTDDDCLVPVEWVSKMFLAVKTHFIVAGNLNSTSTNIYEKMDAYVDKYRISARDSHGKIKFISFPNFGILRSLVPQPTFDISHKNTVEDIELACKLRLSGYDIVFREDIAVEVLYPRSFRELIQRKIKHGSGMAYLESKYTSTEWKQLEMGSKERIIRRWIQISMSSPFPLHHRFAFLMANMAYCYSYLINQKG